MSQESAALPPNEAVNCTFKDIAGCPFQCQQADLKKHLDESTQDHIRLMVHKIKDQEREINHSQVISTYYELVELVIRENRELKTVVSELQALVVNYQDTSVAFKKADSHESVIKKQESVIMTQESVIMKQESMIQKQEKDISWLKNKIFGELFALKLKENDSNTQIELKDLRRGLTQAKEHSAKLEQSTQKIVLEQKSFNANTSRELLELKKTVSQLQDAAKEKKELDDNLFFKGGAIKPFKQLFKPIANIVPPYTFIWKLSNCNSNTYQTGRHLHMSTEFYTSDNWYKMSSVLTIECNHVSIRTGNINGQYDNLIKWPFKCNIKHTVIHPNDQIANICTVSLSYTLSKNNNGWLYTNSVPLINIEDLFKKGYIKDDTLFIGIDVTPQS